MSGRRAAPVVREPRLPCTVGMPTWRAVRDRCTRGESAPAPSGRGWWPLNASSGAGRQARRLEVSKLSKFCGYIVQTSPRGAQGLQQTLVP